MYVYGCSSTIYPFCECTVAKSRRCFSVSLFLKIEAIMAVRPDSPVKTRGWVIEVYSLVKTRGWVIEVYSPVKTRVWVIEVYGLWS